MPDTAVVGDAYLYAFSNLSSGSTSYVWDFGDGKTSTEEIAKLSGMETARVSSLLRYMCKQGIVSF
jgi:hypothetical protein